MPEKCYGAKNFRKSTGGLFTSKIEKMKKFFMKYFL
jgi:hypothetical protein